MKPWLFPRKEEQPATVIEDRFDEALEVLALESPALPNKTADAPVDVDEPPLERLRRRLASGELDGRPLNLWGYMHPDAGRLLREWFNHMDEPNRDPRTPLNPDYFKHKLLSAAAALKAEEASCAGLPQLLRLTGIIPLIPRSSLPLASLRL